MIKKIGLSLLAMALPFMVLAAYLAVRHVVYWSPVEKIAFSSGGIDLAGVLVKPSDQGVFPAILMLHGSGPEATGDPPSRAVVNTLVRSGFAVLYYDKRGVGESGGDFGSATYRDFINDARAAVAYLANRPDVDSERVGLYVVSESGWFAPEIALETGRIAFIFHKVGPPISWADTVAWEMRNDYLAAGVPDSAVDALVAFARERWVYFAAAAKDPALAEGARRDALNREIARLRREVTGAREVLPETLWAYDQKAYGEFAGNANYDPTPFLAALDIPLYYTFGANDINIPTRRCVEVLESLKKEQGKNIGFTVYPDVGHSLASWRGLLDVGYTPGYLDTLASWTKKQAFID